MRSYIAAGLLVGTGALLFASPVSAASAVYRCALGIDVMALYAADGKSVTLYVQDKTLILPQAPSGSGAKYSDGGSTLWEHQGEALFETPGASFTGCKALALH